VSMSDATAGSSAGPRAGRSRDAAASKDALLQAARALFGQRGFEGTTIREIGERAGVDAALIARYFGSKADLYIAAVMAEDAEGHPGEYEGLEQMADAAMTQADRAARAQSFRPSSVPTPPPRSAPPPGTSWSRAWSAPWPPG
jgi:AcrR family transcriptional regulator